MHNPFIREFKTAYSAIGPDSPAAYIALHEERMTAEQGEHSGTRNLPTSGNEIAIMMQFHREVCSVIHHHYINQYNLEP
jgi:hypothetical protein